MLLLALIRVLTVLFYCGMLGCAIVIPTVAFKFAAVLFEKTDEEELATK